MKKRIIPVILDVVVGLVAFAVFVAAVLMAAAAPVQLAASDDFNAHRTTSPRKAVNEEEFVTIGGIAQWVSIRGKDTNAPVLMVVHGGPGAAWSGFHVSQLDAWEGPFIVVRWDQRGAGRTFGKSGPVGPHVTIERMAEDGIEVAEFVRKRLHKQRLILMGISWGSVVGIHMVKLRPDLFSAYVGAGQVVNWRKNEALAYGQVLTKARSANDQAAIEALEKIGPPPYDNQRSLGIRSNWAAHFEAGAPTNAEILKKPFSAPGYTANDAQNWLDGLDSSQEHFFGGKMDGPFTKEDLMKVGPEFKIPMFILQGTEDDIAPFSLAEAYSRFIKAPHVEFVPIGGAGHYAFMTRSEWFLNFLVQHVSR